MPTIVLLRNAGLPSEEIAFKQTQICFALKLRKFNKKHPLTIQFNRFYHTNQRYIKLWKFNKIIFKTPKPTLAQLYYSYNSYKDPIRKMDKETIIKVFIS